MEILVTPDRPNQLWYSQLSQLIIKEVVLPPRSDLLVLPTRKTEELHSKNATRKGCTGLRRVVDSSHESKEVQALTISSWAPKTHSSYNTYIKKWVSYCKSNKILDPYIATYQEVMSILVHLFHKEDQKYGVIALARSALSVILPKIGGKTFQDSNVSQMIKGSFKLRPSLPKYVTTYDPDIMLRYIDSLPHDNFLLLELLTKNVPAKWTAYAVLAGLKIIKIKPIKWYIHILY